MKHKISYQFLNRPGNSWNDDQIKDFVRKLRIVASTCLDEVPNYQCLVDDREFFKRALIVTAVDVKTSKIIGFCSTVLFKMSTKENVLHLGLTCVEPKYRGLNLTHHLTSRAIKGYFLQISPFRPLWITNVACVLSSLGNVAKHFEHVYPSPNKVNPTTKHLQIAKEVAKAHRADFYVSQDVIFNENKFIFEASVAGNSFEKSDDDPKFYHREKKFNNFYRELLNFDRGDEVLQVGYVSVFSVFKFAFKKFKKKHFATKPLFEIDTDGIKTE